MTTVTIKVRKCSQAYKRVVKYPWYAYIVTKFENGSTEQQGNYFGHSPEEAVAEALPWASMGGFVPIIDCKELERKAA